MTRKDYWIALVSSMEQIIGAGLSTVVGIMLPMMQLILHPGLPSLLQGLIGATGLIGIGVGSAVIGKLSDRHGYLLWFRLCPVIIMAGAAICLLLPHTAWLICGLFLAGIGVGGGYSLDSAYISELMPARWRGVMVGVAKATSSIGFIVTAVICYFWLKSDPDPHIWNYLILIIGAAAALTLLMRIRWAESPGWLMDHGRSDEALAAARKFFGPGATLPPAPAAKTQGKATSWGAMFHGENLTRVIFSGIPWACEGLGVYGFGVFLPVLVMALGIESSTVTGMPKVIDSVAVTAVVNFFILPGFVLGLLIMNRCNHVKMLTRGFVLAGVGLALLLAAFLLKWPAWVMIAGFVIFEVSLNAGPHLITFIIPSAIYPVDDRGAGTGIAAMLGKAGAVAGVILMPILLEAGGMTLVLGVSIAVMLLGALIGQVYGKKLGLV